MARIDGKPHPWGTLLNFRSQPKGDPLKISARPPTKKDRKYRKHLTSCAQCQEPTFNIWGRDYPLCPTHNDELIDALSSALEEE